MRNGVARLAYQVYRDSSRSLVWCSGTSTISVTFDWAQGLTQTKDYILYGRVFSSQDSVAAGRYSDALTADLRQGLVSYATTTVPISGSVVSTCSVSSGTLGFGTYDPAAVLDSIAIVTVNCTNGTPYAISLGGGLKPSGSTRRMTGPGGSLLAYQLFRDAARSNAWGDGVLTGSKVSGSGSGAQQNLPVYGRISANQLVPAGTYSDTVQVTVEY